MTLGELFAGIANAIRMKDGTTAAIPATTFPERIRALSAEGGGGPFAKVSMMEGPAGEIVSRTVNISARVSVTAVDYEEPKDYTHALYNGVRLPKIPESDLASYPYAWIRKNTISGYYDLILTAVPGYYDPSASSNPGIVYGPGAAMATAAQYRVSIANAASATAWSYNQTTTNWFGLDSNRVIFWSNHDIPNGSPTATDIYLEGTDPVPTD